MFIFSGLNKYRRHSVRVQFGVDKVNFNPGESHEKGRIYGRQRFATNFRKEKLLKTSVIIRINYLREGEKLGVAFYYFFIESNLI